MWFDLQIGIIWCQLGIGMRLPPPSPESKPSGRWTLCDEMKTDFWSSRIESSNDDGWLNQKPGTMGRNTECHVGMRIGITCFLHYNLQPEALRDTAEWECRADSAGTSKLLRAADGFPSRQLLCSHPARIMHKINGLKLSHYCLNNLFVWFRKKCTTKGTRDGEKFKLNRGKLVWSSVWFSFVLVFPGRGFSTGWRS